MVADESAVPARSEGRGIVVGVDGSHVATAALRWAAQDAAVRGTSLTIVHVVEPQPPPSSTWAQVPVPPGFTQWRDREARRIVEDAAGVADRSAPGTVPVHTEIVYGAPVPALVEFSGQADMLVVGYSGLGAIRQALLGSVTEGVLQRAGCPVAVIHGEQPRSVPSRQAPVLVGVDGSPTSELAAEVAFAEAAWRGVELVALHAWSDLAELGPPGMGWSPADWLEIHHREDQMLADWLAPIRQRYPTVVVNRLVVSGRPARRLVENTVAAQLVVVGSRGRGGFTGLLLGSVSRAVVSAAETPVIVARPR